MREREALIKRLEDEEYKRRESGNSDGVIPAARSSASEHSDNEDQSHVAGAVSGTDSENESEFLTKL